MDPFLDTIFRKIRIEIDLGFIDDFKIRCYNNCFKKYWVSRLVTLFRRILIRSRTF
jgi:hypothetical protein